MMKAIKLLLLAALTFSLALLSAEGWVLNSDVNVTLTQSAFSDNWTGSELSNITWVASSNSSAQKQMADWLNNRTTLKLAFGQTHLQKTDSLGIKYWQEPDKTTDKIDLESLFKFTLQKWVDPYAALRFESQFLDESDATLTRIVNPMLFTESAGIMKTFLETEKNHLSLRLGGAVRERLNRDEMNLTTNERELVTTVDGGLEAVAEFKHILRLANASFNSKFWAYQALFNSKSDDLNNDWKALDYVWENILTTKLWGFLSANLTFELRYEKEAIDEIQWKQILGLGFTYTLF